MPIQLQRIAALVFLDAFVPADGESLQDLQDRVIVPAADLEIGGTALYADRYTKTDAGWRIAHTGYMRVFEEHRTHSTLAVISFSSRFKDAGSD